MAASRTPTGFADTEPRASQRGSFYVQGRGRSVVAWENQRDYADGWSLFGSIFERPGNRSSFLFLRRATRLRRELYEVLGVWVSANELG